MNRRTILHFLCGYLMLLFGVIVLMIPFYYNTLSLLEKKQMTLAQEQLTGGLRQLDQQLESLHGIAYSIAQDVGYRTMARKDADELTPADCYQLQRLHTEFARLCMAQPYAEDSGLLLSNNVLFTRERIHLPSQDDYGVFIRFGDMDKETFLSTFGHPDTQWTFLPCMEVVSESGSSQALVWLCSMSQTLSRSPAGVLYATFSVETLTGLLMPDYDAEEAGFTLLSGAGEVLMQSGLAPRGEGQRTLTATSAQSGLTVSLRLSGTLFTNMMQPAVRLMVISFGLLVLAGLCLCAVLAIRSSRPVDRLVELASSVDSAGPEETASSSFEYIGRTVTNLAFSVDLYRQALTNQQQSVRDHVFEALLRETPVRESASSRRRLREFGQCFPDFPERYQLALIVLPDEEEENQLEYLSLRQVALLELIRTQLTPAPYVFSGGHHVVAVLGARSDGDWAQELAALRRTALETQRLHLMIALSDEGHGCEQLHALYQSVQGIIHCASQMDGQLLDVWQRGNFPDQPRKVPLDYAEMSQLHTLLLHAEKTGALSLLHTVYEGTRAATFLDEVMNRQVYYNIRSVILRVKAERYEELSSLEIPDYHGDLSENELIEQLSACCERVCDLLGEAARGRQTSFAASFCRYIDEHLGDSALSVRLVADHFAISEPTLQKAIRMEKGCSFFDYVEQQRYERALSLLRSTSLPIAEVAKVCGFNSTNAFYKAFKRKSSITPAVVRMQAREASLLAGE